MKLQDAMKYAEKAKKQRQEDRLVEAEEVLIALADYIKESCPILLTRKLKAKVNGKLANLPNMFDTLRDALQAVWGVLDEFDVTCIGDNVPELENESHITYCFEIQDDKNVCLILALYRFATGRYEVMAYLS